jgi:hypothetical protein
VVGGGFPVGGYSYGGGDYGGIGGSYDDGRAVQVDIRACMQGIRRRCCV